MTRKHIITSFRDLISTNCARKIPSDTLLRAFLMGNAPSVMQFYSRCSTLCRLSSKRARVNKNKRRIEREGEREGVNNERAIISSVEKQSHRLVDMQLPAAIKRI